MELLELLGVLPPKNGRTKDVRYNVSPLKKKGFHLKSGDVRTVAKCIDFESHLYHLALTKFENALEQARALITRA